MSAEYTGQIAEIYAFIQLQTTRVIVYDGKIVYCCENSVLFVIIFLLVIFITMEKSRWKILPMYYPFLFGFP